MRSAGVLRTLDKAVDVMSRLALWVSGLLILAMAFVITYGVAMRYFFHRPSSVAMELMKILMVPGLVLGVSFVEREKRHLKVDFISRKFPEKVQIVLFEIIVPLAALFVGYVLVWKSGVAAAYSYSIHETSYCSWAEPLWPVKMTIPVGYGLLCVILLAKLCKGAALLIRGGAVESVKAEPPKGQE